MEQDLTDQQLAEIAKRKREQIEADRQQGKPEAVKDRLADTLTRIQDRYTKKGQKPKKTKEKKGAHPRIIDGHIDIANEIADRFEKTHLPGREWQILWVLFRQTWGYCELKKGRPYKNGQGMFVKKKFDRISLTQFEKFTGLDRRNIYRCLQSLIRKNIVIKSQKKKSCKYGIEVDWTKWKVKSLSKMTLGKK